MDVLYIQLGHMTIVITLLNAHLLLEFYCEVLQEDTSSSTAVLIISLLLSLPVVHVLSNIRPLNVENTKCNKNSVMNNCTTVWCLLIC